MRTAHIAVGRHQDHAEEERRVAAYLPDNYRVTRTFLEAGEGWVIEVEGKDVAGWTMDGYVLPRLASGLMFGKEVEHDCRHRICGQHPTVAEFDPR